MRPSAFSSLWASLMGTEFCKLSLLSSVQGCTPYPSQKYMYLCFLPSTERKSLLFRVAKISLWEFEFQVWRKLHYDTTTYRQTEEEQARGKVSAPFPIPYFTFLSLFYRYMLLCSGVDLRERWCSWFWGWWCAIWLIPIIYVLCTTFIIMTIVIFTTKYIHNSYTWVSSFLLTFPFTSSQHLIFQQTVIFTITTQLIASNPWKSKSSIYPYLT